MSTYHVIECRRIERDVGTGCIVAIINWDDGRTILVRQTLDEDGAYSWDRIMMYGIRTADTLDSLMPAIDRFFDSSDVERRMMVSSSQLRRELIAATGRLLG
ncbi:hypothetical protein Enr13x_39520 [Stieleria neptunia]|uniref:Uncharacterized protein n=1 Tax=Stieleria neptunia TaxID=2527979 RepID=A0A518HTE4_9BACT|nr:hypothetical protein [Stieleria neptunia]QDV44091.1 hypothetical protein Enr13x_39520 [Stieleria neptunia]